MKCRHCGFHLEASFVDLGFAPPSNSYLNPDGLEHPEVHYPLRVKVCDNCWLVQTEDYASAEDLFNSNYAYFSSTSVGWLAHASDFCNMITERLQLSSESFVVEVASNDGYLLRNFVAKGIPCVGIEPTASTAEVAKAAGVPVICGFFSAQVGASLASAGRQADLVVGNNVYAHVPDINDFTRGLAAALKPQGTVTLEFPHLLPLIEHVQFDTIYHEHFSYLSLTTASRIFGAAGLRIWDVEELSTHGGSLRVYGCHVGADKVETGRVAMLRAREDLFGITRLETYTAFQARVDGVKNNFVAYLIEQKRAGRKLAAYGAAAKGNTLLNYAGVRPDLLPYVCDAAVAKQGKLMPGSHIPIRSPDVLLHDPPDEVLILPWNIAGEIRSQLSFLTTSRFVTVIPKLNFSRC